MRVTGNDAEGRGGGVKRFVRVTAALLVLVAVGGWFAVRTAGARGLIQDWLGKRLGMAIEADDTRIVWPYDLRIDGMRSSSFADGTGPGVAVRRMRLGWRPSGWRLALDGCRVRLRNERDGTWTPTTLARLGECLGARVSDVSAMTASFREWLRVRVSEGELVWLAADGQECAAANGIRLSITPIRVPERALFHFVLEVHSIRGAEAAHLRDMRWEWLATEGSDYMELASRGRAVGARSDGSMDR